MWAHTRMGAARGHHEGLGQWEGAGEGIVKRPGALRGVIGEVESHRANEKTEEALGNVTACGLRCQCC